MTERPHPDHIGEQENNPPRLKSIVIFSRDVDETVKLYSAALDLPFIKEQHGNGPIHYSTQLESGILMEIYPGDQQPRVGFEVESVDDTVHRLAGEEIFPRHPAKDSKYGRYTTLQDPGSGIIELREPQNDTQ